MFPPFPVEEAHAECLNMINQLDDGILVMKQVTSVSEERGRHGIMLGALVCRNSDGRRIVLKTLSGISRAICPADGLTDPDSVYVPPIVSAAQINSALIANDALIHKLTEKITELKNIRRSLGFAGSASEPSEEEKKLLEKRAVLTDESLRAVYSLYSFCCADGKVRKLNEICGRKFPPTGTGDCCAPKLLDYAFRHNLVPVSMDEVFYGSTTQNRRNGESYPPCRERCGLILPAMLGIEIIYRDSDIIVVNKQSGVLSVPGRGPDKQDCIVNRVRRLFPECIEQPSVHRLDMETSGLLILAFTADAHRALNRQFEKGEVHKQYAALLDGVLENACGQNAPARGENSGCMELYFRLDIENRPHQIWDEVHGKKAVTEWIKTGTQLYFAPDGSGRKATRILFTPRTGRTHQLRLASADIHGFAVPIIGDSLYGTCGKGERLMLHAQYISFIHPVSGRRMEFYSEPEF